jgi:hypothetical protein
MLDFGKLQADAVKSICKSKITGQAADYEFYSVVTIDGNAYIPLAYKRISLYLIPEKYSLLNPTFAQVGKLMAEKILRGVEDTQQLADTDTIRVLKGKQLREFKTKDDKSIFVDEKLLKPFGQDVIYYAGENSNIVYIKEVEEWLGLAFVTRVKENE